jgi:hypothetical protein
MSYKMLGISRQVHYHPAYCYDCGLVVFVRQETGSYSRSVPKRCPLCDGTDVESISARLANTLQNNLSRLEARNEVGYGMGNE